MNLRINLKWSKTWLWLFAAIVVAGCTAQAATPAAKQERSETGLQYEVVKPPYQDFLQEALQAQKQKKAAAIIPKGKHAYVLITLGQRPSAGYKIVIDQVEKKKDQIIIHYSEKKPEGMAASVISYPSLVLKLPGTSLPIYVQKNN